MANPSNNCITKTLNEITKQYQTEYFKKQTVEQTGFWGKVNRVFSGFDGDHINAELPRVVLSGIAVAVSGELIGSLFSIIVAPVTVSVMLITVALAGASYNVTNYRAKRLIKQDIDNGILLARYNAEVLEPRATALNNQISNIAKSSKLKSSFDANKVELKPVTTQPPTAKTELKP